jgi:hypothetical protein
MSALRLATDFPVLAREGLVYLDSAATAQKPRQVIDAMSDFMEHHNASVHRGVYTLAVEATDAFEGGRQKAADFVGSRPQRDDLHRQRDPGGQPRRPGVGPREPAAGRSRRRHRDGAPLGHPSRCT